MSMTRDIGNARKGAEQGQAAQKQVEVEVEAEVEVEVEVEAEAEVEVEVKAEAEAEAEVATAAAAAAAAAAAEAAAAAQAEEERLAVKVKEEQEAAAEATARAEAAAAKAAAQAEAEAVAQAAAEAAAHAEAEAEAAAQAEAEAQAEAAAQAAAAEEEKAARIAAEQEAARLLAADTEEKLRLATEAVDHARRELEAARSEVKEAAPRGGYHSLPSDHPLRMELDRASKQYSGLVATTAAARQQARLRLRHGVEKRKIVLPAGSDAAADTQRSCRKIAEKTSILSLMLALALLLLSATYNRHSSGLFAGLGRSGHRAAAAPLPWSGGRGNDAHGRSSNSTEGGTSNTTAMMDDEDNDSSDQAGREHATYAEPITIPPPPAPAPLVVLPIRPDECPKGWAGPECNRCGPGFGGTFCDLRVAVPPAPGAVAAAAAAAAAAAQASKDSRPTGYEASEKGAGAFANAPPVPGAEWGGGVSTRAASTGAGGAGETAVPTLRPFHASRDNMTETAGESDTHSSSGGGGGAGVVVLAGAELLSVDRGQWMSV